MPARQLLEDHSSAPAIAITIPVRLIGMLVLAIVGLLMVALASWSVDDPSLSYATSKPVANWLGFPGAVIADISFQVLGLGVIVLLIPLALWGWSFVRRRVPEKMGLRLVAWIAATGLSTGVLAFMSSILGSVTIPDGGEICLYKASKAALNSMINSFVVELQRPDLCVLAMHPGWVKTEMGGENAEIDVLTSTRGMLDQVKAQSGNAGLRFINYKGEALVW